MSRLRILALCLTSLGLLTAPARSLADEAEDVERLKKEIGSADAPTLLDYLRSQISTPETSKKIAKLIEELGSPNFRTRQNATRQLIDIGPVAIAQLRLATNHTDKEIAGRARRAINEIESGPRFDLPVVAMRQLGRLKEPKAVELMLALLPPTAEDRFHAEIMEALTAVGVSGKEIHPTLLKALDDPKQRTAAVQLLLRSDDAEIRKRMKTYLNDDDPSVRFHVAMNLLKRGDRDAVPVLINVIADAPNAIIWQQAEEALYALGGELAPSVVVNGPTAEDRKAIAEQWAAWWKAKGDQVLLDRKDDYPTNVCVVAETGASNRVYEWRPEGAGRFKLTDNLVSPVDARSLPGNRVLIAEQSGRRVTERDHRGRILWEQAFDDGPVSVMRLPNGNTFVSTMNRVLEVRRDGQIVYSYPCDPNTSISDANRLPDGRIAMITTDGEVIWLGPNGKELKRIKGDDSQGAIEGQPNGHILVSQIGAGRITEYDAKGDKVFDLNIPGAWMATKLPDGNLLIANKAQRKILKYDTKGKLISEHNVEGIPHAIHWR